MIVKDIFGIKTTINGFVPEDDYTHRTDCGLVITVNAGVYHQSREAAHRLAAVYDAANSTPLKMRADSEANRAFAAERRFSCNVSQEIKLLPAPAPVVV